MYLIIISTFIITLTSAEWNCSSSGSTVLRYQQNTLVYPSGSNNVPVDCNTNISIEIPSTHYASLEIDAYLLGDDDVLFISYNDNFKIGVRGKVFRVVSLPPPISHLQLMTSNVTTDASLRIIITWKQFINTKDHMAAPQSVVPNAQPKALINNRNSDNTWVITAQNKVAITAIVDPKTSPLSLMSLLIFNGNASNPNSNTTFLGTLYESFLTKKPLISLGNMVTIRLTNQTEDTFMIVQDSADLIYSNFEAHWAFPANGGNYTVTLDATEGQALLLLGNTVGNQPIYITDIEFGDLANDTEANLTIYINGNMANPLFTYTSSDNISDYLPQVLLGYIRSIVLDSGTATITINGDSAGDSWSIVKRDRRGFIDHENYPDVMPVSELWSFNTTGKEFEYSLELKGCALTAGAQYELTDSNETTVIQPGMEYAGNCTELQIAFMSPSPSRGCIPHFAFRDLNPTVPNKLSSSFHLLPLLLLLPFFL